MAAVKQLLRRTVAAAILTLSLVFTQPSIAATGTVNFNTTYQQLEGFGGAAVYDCGNLITHEDKETVYNLLFKDLGIEILRIRNTYGYSSGSGDLTATATIVAEAREPQRSPNLKIELVPWSPAYYLKSNGDESGGGTLAGGPSSYVYAQYAQWWYDSLLEWADHSVEADFISLQNEPDWESDYDSCKFGATESSSYAGYDKAFEAVYNKLNTEMGPNMPQMWAPCTMGFGNSQAYINALVSRGQIDNVDGFSHHLYSDGSYDDPDGMISDMTDYGNDYGYKPLHMTEYVKLGTTPNFDMGWKFAWHIYNCLYYEGVTSFFNWTLFRGPNPDGGGIVTMTSTSAYAIRPQYWFLKAYTYFTDRDWYVINTSVAGTGASNLRMSAFKSPDNSKLTIVILNVTTSSTSLTLTINNYTPQLSEVYRTSPSEIWEYQGTYNPSMTIPGQSITTIALYPPAGPQQTLSISSTSGGSVTTPGEGDFQYNHGSYANIIATAEQYYHFDVWTGSAVTAGKVADPCTASTTVLMDANYAVVANFEANPPSTDIEILGSWATGLSHTEESGYSRALIFITHAEDDVAITLNSVTYGGQTMTPVIERVTGTSGYRAYVAAYILDDAGIDAATNGTFVPGWVTTPENVSYASVFLGSVDQTTPVGATASNSTTSSTPNPITTSALSTDDGDMVIDAAVCGNTGDYTLLNGFTEALEHDMGSSTGTDGYKSATGADETPSAQHTNVNRQAIIGFVVQAAPVVDDPPAAPTALAATAGNGLVSLDWNDNNEVDVNGYNVYRSTTQGSGYGKINISLVADSNYIDSDVNNGTPYYYVVTAVDINDNESIYSIEASATPDYQDCNDVQAGDDGLVSDINGDCYVDLLDVEIIAGHWLHTDCAGLDDCEKADFEPDGDVDLVDFSDFAADWLNCNEPGDLNCTPNW